MLVQALVPKFSVERFDKSILLRFAWLNEIKFDLVFKGPLIHCFARELAAVVDDNALWILSSVTNANWKCKLRSQVRTPNRHRSRSKLNPAIHDREFGEPKFFRLRMPFCFLLSWQRQHISRVQIVFDFGTASVRAISDIDEGPIVQRRISIRFLKLGPMARAASLHNA
jgi:hypothetical protein